MYGGLGVGYATLIDYEAFDEGDLQIEDDNGLAVQGRLGFAYNLGGNYDARFGYRYFRTESVDIDNVTSGASDELDIGQHSLELAFRWGL
jgi:opacity protein-like surface antigen